MAPALFVAGFSLPAASLQRVFAIVELMRAVAAFMIAPIFAHFAATVGGGAAAGTGNALWIGSGLAIGGAAIAVLLYALGGARPQTPDLERFIEGEGSAWYSPPLLARVRQRRAHRSLVEETVGVMTTDELAAGTGPVIFAYDGSELAKLAIDDAARQLRTGRDALVVTVWQPFDVGFVPVGGLQFDAEQAAEVRHAAELTAAGGSLTRRAGGIPGPQCGD